MKTRVALITNRSMIAWLGMSAVLLGAFGAHILKGKISAYQMGIWEKAIQYQIWHVLAMLYCIVAERLDKRAYTTPLICFALGICFFSGSLFGLALVDYHAIPSAMLGPLTPIGGVCLLIGWGALALRIRQLPLTFSSE